MEIKSEISNLASNFLNKNFSIKADVIEIQNTRKEFEWGLTFQENLLKDCRIAFRKLKPGMFMIVKLPIMTRKNAIIVPEESILTDGTQRTIYIIDEGITKAKSVKLGQRLSGEVEILEGLENNAMVITGGIQKVRDGSKVTIR